MLISRTELEIHNPMYAGAYGPTAFLEIDKNILSNALIKVKLVQIWVDAPVTGVPKLQRVVHLNSNLINSFIPH